MQLLSILVLITLCITSVLSSRDTSESDTRIAQSILNNMDESVSPCDDFYQYSCGGWLGNVTLPEQLSRYVRTFNGIEDANREFLYSIVNDPSNDLIHSFYTSCMDTEAIEVEGIHRLQSIFDYIDMHAGNATTSTMLQKMYHIAGYLRRYDISLFLSSGVVTDVKNPQRYITQIGQSGMIGLSASQYISAKDETICEQYKDHITRMFELVGLPHSRQHAQLVFSVESRLAEVTEPSENLRDPERSNNMFSVEQLKREMPNIDWDAYFMSFGIQPTIVNVASLEYIQYLSDLMKQLTFNEMIAYFKWRTLTKLQEFMPKRFRDENFNFFSRKLRGIHSVPSREEICLDSTTNTIGFALGKKFVEQAFSTDSKETVQRMVDDIESSLKSTLETVPWMDEITKKRALQKLSNIRQHIGYPQEWETYGSYNSSLSFFDNQLNMLMISSRHMAQRVEQPVNPHHWSIPPQVVNAFYSPVRNSINFPAAILSTPFFDKDFPDAMNYGAIGFVISHEFLHAFDDQGRKYDSHGRLEDWWTPEASLAYQNRIQCIAEQYSNFEPVDGCTINGNLTLGENISDSGAIHQAYKALRHRIGDIVGKSPSSIIPSLTEYQLFYVSFAQAWCAIETEEETRQRLSLDVHSPPRFRVLGTLQNSEHFSQAFSCPSRSGMNPEKKCHVF